MISIIYVHYKVEKLLEESIKSILKNPPKARFEIIVVDNSQSTILSSALKIYDKVKLVSSRKNIGFGSACNVGAKKAKGKYLLFLNPDTIVVKGSLDLMLKKLRSDKKIGILGPRLVNRKGQTLPSISKKISKWSMLVAYSLVNSIWKNNPVSKSFWLMNADRTKEQEVDVLSGACLFMTNEVFRKVKGFDERFFMYFEEYDICNKVQKKGYKAIYYPNAKVVHYVGKSLSDKKRIKKYFEKSRFLYSRKHFGLFYALLSEMLIRSFKINVLAFLAVFTASLWVNTYKLDTLMLFFGDIARDFEAARQMATGEAFQLVGIPSSVTWLHQGPLSIWLIAFVLSITNFNVTSVAFAFALVNAFTSAIVYILGVNYFNRRVGIIASILYMTSPIVVVNARMPYHTSLVPLFVAIFFLILPKFKDKKFLPVISFFLGLTLLVELSNSVLLGVLLVLLYFSRVKFQFWDLSKNSIALLLGILPFVIYDLINGPTYVKFPIWIIYRLVKPFLNTTNQSGSDVVSFLPTSYQQISGVLLPQLPIAAILFLIFALGFLVFKFLKLQEKYLGILLIWLLVPLLAFLLHRSPGTAYFTLIYIPLTLLAGVFLSGTLKIGKAIVATIVIASINLHLLLTSNYFVTTSNNEHKMPPLDYAYGNSWKYSQDTAFAILKDAEGGSVNIILSDERGNFTNSIYPYVFFINSNGGKVDEKSISVYMIYDAKTTSSRRVLYRNYQDVVVKSQNGV